MQYIEPVGAQGPANAYGHDYVDKNAGAGIAGSFLAADVPEHTMLELVALIQKSGLTPSGSDLMQALKAVRSQRLNYVATVSGTANALTATLDPAVTSYSSIEGMPLKLKCAAANSGPVTLSLNGLAALKVLNPDGSELYAGELAANRVVEVFCITSAFVIRNPFVFFQRQTPKGARLTSAFTPGVAFSDIPTLNTDLLVQSVSVTGATYLDVTGTCGFRNTTASSCNTTVQIKLFRTSPLALIGEAQFQGCISINNLQIPATSFGTFQNLDPAVTYSVQLIARKQQAVGPIEVSDPCVTVSSD
jgi:hypothetical protein